MFITRPPKEKYKRSYTPNDTHHVRETLDEHHAEHHAES